MNNTFDIIIIGGGIAGCIAAMHLHPFYKVLIIEKKETSKVLHGETLVASSKRIFNELGINIEQIMQDTNIGQPAVSMQSYWGTSEAIYQDSFRNPEGNGWSIEKNNFINALQEITRKQNITILREEISQVNQLGNQWNIETKNSDGSKKRYRSNFIIDASGRRSIMAQKTGIKRIKKDQLIGIHANIKLPKNTKSSTIYPVKNGWWYIAKLPNHKHLISFFTDADLCDKKLTKVSEQFKSYLLEQTELNEILAINKDELEFQFLGTKASNSSILEPIPNSNWIAIGDASMTFDPLSSQGMFNALAMATQISKLIIQSNVVHTLSEKIIAAFHSECNKMIENIWSHYEYHHFVYYLMEKRWPQETFWSRRQIIR